MKPSERDELLGRLDERSHNTWRIVEEIKKGQDTQNDAIAQNTQNIAVLKDRGVGIKTKLAGGVSALGFIAWSIRMWLSQQPPS